MDEILDLDIGFHEVSSKTSDDYYTPKWIFDAIGLEFDLDVSAPPGGSPWIPAKNHFTIIDDGLAQEPRTQLAPGSRAWRLPPTSWSTRASRVTAERTRAW